MENLFYKKFKWLLESPIPPKAGKPDIVYKGPLVNGSFGGKDLRW